MKLKQYLHEKGLTDREFGEAVGASERAVIKWKRGERVPRPDAMSRIIEATSGLVTANDFYSDQASPVPAEAAQ